MYLAPQMCLQIVLSFKRRHWLTPWYWTTYWSSGVSSPVWHPIECVLAWMSTSDTVSWGNHVLVYMLGLALRYWALLLLASSMECQNVTNKLSLRVEHISRITFWPLAAAIAELLFVHLSYMLIETFLVMERGCATLIPASEFLDSGRDIVRREMTAVARGYVGFICCGVLAAKRRIRTWMKI